MKVSLYSRKIDYAYIFSNFAPRIATIKFAEANLTEATETSMAGTRTHQSFSHKGFEDNSGTKGGIQNKLECGE